METTGIGVGPGGVILGLGVVSLLSALALSVDLSLFFSSLLAFSLSLCFSSHSSLTFFISSSDALGFVSPPEGELTLVPNPGSFKCPSHT